MGEIGAFAGIVSSSSGSGGGGSGVTSFNTRTGAVVPVVGDYSMSGDAATFYIAPNAALPGGDGNATIGTNTSTPNYPYLAGTLIADSGTPYTIQIGPGGLTALNFGTVDAGAIAQVQVGTPAGWNIPLSYNFAGLPDGIIGFATTDGVGDISVRVVNFSGAPVDLSSVAFEWTFVFLANNPI